MDKLRNPRTRIGNLYAELSVPDTCDQNTVVAEIRKRIVEEPHLSGAHVKFQHIHPVPGRIFEQIQELSRRTRAQEPPGKHLAVSAPDLTPLSCGQIIQLAAEHLLPGSFAEGEHIVKRTEQAARDIVRKQISRLGDRPFPFTDTQQRQCRIRVRTVPVVQSEIQVFSVRRHCAAEHFSRAALIHQRSGTAVRVHPPEGHPGFRVSDAIENGMVRIHKQHSVRDRKPRRACLSGMRAAWHAAQYMLRACGQIGIKEIAAGIRIA